MRILISFAFYIMIGTWSFVAAPIGWILFLAYECTGSKRIRRLARSVNWIYGRVAIALMAPFFKIKLVNTHFTKQRGACIIVCNHQSILDLYMLGAQGNDQVCPVTKLWPFRLLFPFAPSMLAAGYVNVQGRDKEDVRRDCGQRLADGAALVFYPEGRRSRDGSLGKFHAGAFVMAMQARVPLYIMILRGTRNAIKPGNFIIKPGAIEVEVMAPLGEAEFREFDKAPLPHRALMKYVKNIYKQKLQEETHES